MRSPSELEVVDSASGDRLAIIGDDRGVSKSSSDNGLVNGLAAVEEVFAATVGFALEAAPVEMAFTDTASVVFGIEGALICEDALSNDANELVSDRVGLPPTFGLCGGGLGGGALGREGRVDAMEAGLLADDFFEVVVLVSADEAEAEAEAEVITMVARLDVGLFACLRGVIGGGCEALTFLF